MNPSRLFLAIVAGFVFIFGSDYLIHAIWLAPDYKATEALWRPEPEMQRRVALMVIAQLLCSIAFMYVWAKTGWRRRSIADGCVFGFWLGMFQQVMTIVIYVVVPMPIELAGKWFGAGLVQAVLLGALGAAIYKPRSTLTEPRA